METQVHRVVVLVVDHDDLGPDGVKDVLENSRYPNRCMSPEVVATETKTVQWTDDHPLNKAATWEAEYHRLFPKGD